MMVLMMMMRRRIAIADDSTVGVNVVGVAAELDELLRRVDLRLGEMVANLSLLHIIFVIGCGFA